MYVLKTIVSSTEEADKIIRSNPIEVIKLLKTILKNIPTSDDLVQDIYIKLLKYIKSYDCKHLLSTWITTVCLNERRRYYINNKNKKKLDQYSYYKEHEHSVGHPIEGLLVEDRIKVIRKHLATYPPRDRAVLELIYIDGLSVRNTANRLQSISPAMVHVITRKFREKMASRLDMIEQAV